MDSINGRLACFELWGGNRMADHAVELPGLAGWVYSAPLDPAAAGGDIYYFSVCSKGMLSRIAVADVAGHGSRASLTAESLHSAVHRHTNNWDQSTLMQELNNTFSHDPMESPYATAVLLGFYSQTGELLFSSAGHPPPFWYRQTDKSWHLLQDCCPFAVHIEGLPLGVIPGTRYSQKAVRLEEGDVLVLYTDGITETRDSSNNELGVTGFLQMARTLTSESPLDLTRTLLSGVRTLRGSAPRRDDDTLIILRRVGAAQ